MIEEQDNHPGLIKIECKGCRAPLLTNPTSSIKDWLKDMNWRMITYGDDTSFVCNECVGDMD